MAKHQWVKVPMSKAASARFRCAACGMFWTMPAVGAEPPADGCTPPVVEERAPDTDFESAAEASARLQAERDADPAREYDHGRRRRDLRDDPIAAAVPLGPRTVDFRPDLLIEEGGAVPAFCCPEGCGNVGVERRTVLLDSVVRGIEMVEYRCERCETVLLRVLVYLTGGPWPWQTPCEHVAWARDKWRFGTAAWFADARKRGGA